MSVNLRSVTWTVMVSALFAAAGAAACGSPSTAPTPVVPSAPPATSTPPLPTGQIHITGTVRNERGEPLAGATIQLVSTPSVTAVSDPTGAYALTGRVTVLAGYDVKAEKPGFEFSLQFVRSGSNTQDFQLRDIVRISPGDTTTVTVTPSDSLYGFDLEWRRRTVRLVAPRSGVIDLEVVPENATTPGAIGLGPSEFPCCPSRRSVSVAAGEEVLIHLLIFWNNATDQTFRLHTTFAR